MTNILIPERHNIYIELRPYFDDQEYLLKMDDADLVEAYSEMKFLKYNLINPEDLGWEEI